MPDCRPSWVQGSASLCWELPLVVLYLLTGLISLPLNSCAAIHFLLLVLSPLISFTHAGVANGWLHWTTVCWLPVSPDDGLTPRVAPCLQISFRQSVITDFMRLVTGLRLVHSYGVFPPNSLAPFR